MNALEALAKTIKTDVVSSNLQYLGVSQSILDVETSPTWDIKRSSRVGNVVTESWVYGKRWIDRTSLFPSVTYDNAYSVDFDGVNDVVNFGNNFNFEHSQAWSLSVWLNPNNLAASRCFYSKCTADVSVYGYNFLITSAGKIQVQVRTASSVTSYTGTTTWSAGTWQHFTFTWSGSSNLSGMRIYRNAVVDSTPGSAALGGSLLLSQSALVGTRNGSFPWSGKIDELTIWNKSLSAAEVSDLYNGGAPTSPTGHSAAANLQNWYRFGDGDTYPTVLDNQGSVNGTMENMVGSSNFVVDVP